MLRVPVVEEQPAPSPAPAPVPRPKPVASTKLAPARDPTPARIPVPVEEPAPVPAAITRPKLDREIAALDLAFASRGLLPADAPELFTERRRLTSAIAADQAGEREIEELRVHVESMVLDRAFIEGKLRRLQGQIEHSGLSETSRQEFLRHSQAALSQAVTGNYAQANRELNAIAAMLEQK